MNLKWEKVKNKGAWMLDLRRAEVPGGWLVIVMGWGVGSGITFYPDPRHEWNP